MGWQFLSHHEQLKAGGVRRMKKFLIAVIGGTVGFIGVAMLVVPGPGALVIAGGLAILATEFIWARSALRNAKGAVAKVRRKSGLKEWLRPRKARASLKLAPAEKI
jgi:uncharacterized protein (TIGR02611 family)